MINREIFKKRSRNSTIHAFSLWMVIEIVREFLRTILLDIFFLLFSFVFFSSVLFASLFYFAHISISTSVDSIATVTEKNENKIENSFISYEECWKQLSVIEIKLYILWMPNVRNLIFFNVSRHKYYALHSCCSENLNRLSVKCAKLPELCDSKRWNAINSRQIQCQIVEIHIIQNMDQRFIMVFTSKIK